MFLLKIVKFSFFIFCVILYSKAYTTSKYTIEQLDKLLNYPGWKNLNDLDYIKYYRKSYYLHHLIKTPTHREMGELKIRSLTIYLGCTYAKVIKSIFSIIINWQEMYKENKEDNHIINGCIYTQELINTIATFIVPIATLLKGAMDALDLLHNLPWSNFKSEFKKSYLISPLLDRIGNILDELNEPIPLYDNLSTNSSKFEIIYLFSKRLIRNIQFETLIYCKYVPNTNDLWNGWVYEYNAIIKQGANLIFFKFLTKKIKDYIKKEILEKYFQLGFKFDPITNETYIPTPKQLIEQELEFKATDEEPPTPVQIEIH
ncbi:uncharacterized protein LOC126907396 isoform X2 [Daktulosphaira vitifoliae]|uniref:uncharacterized protein LOC126907396 isoform X2 n=1 Tax=Daktulosphaira vitifoliae TaxID=58002 RepID=UPI0021A9ADDB|nr:uncharacterized protein LOC126907396 isoform X2 [Daktulosphaira vitifoliae]